MDAADDSLAPPDFERRFGIRMQTTRSRAPKQWWSLRWHEYVESLRMGARLGRGRQYATGGNIKSLEIGPGFAEAIVGGSGPEPYRCRIECETAGGRAGGELAAGLRGRPMLLARILAGDLPEELETRFRASGTPLVPTSFAPLSAHCSCPDGAEFCKHAAAVLLLLGEIFDREPMLLLEMRGVRCVDVFGLDRDALVAALAAPARPEIGGQPAGAGAPPRPDFTHSLVEFPGQLPFWRGESRFADTVRECSERAAADAAAMLAGALPKRRAGA